MVKDNLLNALATAALAEVSSAKCKIGGTVYNCTIDNKRTNGNLVDVSVKISAGGQGDTISQVQLFNADGEVIAERDENVERTDAQYIMYLFTIEIDAHEEA